MASHDTIKLLKVEARRTNLISMALSGKDDDGTNLISMALSGKDDDGTKSDRARDSTGPIRVTRLSTCS